MGRRRAAAGLLRRIVLGLCCCVAGLADRSGWAAEWAVVPSMGVKGYVNDNLLLTPLPHQPTYGFWLMPGAEFAGKTERLEVSGRAALDFVSYYGGENTDFTNIHLPVTARYRTETDTFGFTGGFTRDNTLMGELLTTGVVVRFTQRNLWTANPTWTRKVTEKLAVQGTFQFSDAAYENGLRLGLVDYQLFGASAGLLYQVTERTQAQFSGTYTNFHTTNAPFDLRASFPGLIATASHAFTETLTGAVFGGPRFVTSTTKVAGDRVRSRETVWVYGATLTQQFEQASVQLNVSREVIPSGFGLLLQTDRAGVSAIYHLSETVDLSLDTSGYLVSGVTRLAGGGTLADQRLIYTTPLVAWKFAEWWKLEVSYSYRWRDVDTFADPAMANIGMVMLTYFPPKLAVSH